MTAVSKSRIGEGAELIVGKVPDVSQRTHPSFGDSSTTMSGFRARQLDTCRSSIDLLLSTQPKEAPNGRREALRPMILAW